MDYKKEIIKIILEIDSEKFLKFLHDMILAFKRDWGY